MNYNKISKAKLIGIIMVLIILILIVVIDIIYNNNNSVRYWIDKYIFMKEKYEDNSPQILIDKQASSNSYAYKGNIIIVDNNVLYAYDAHGNIDYKLEIEISKPMFKSNGNYLCVAEENGKKLYVISNKNILWQKNFEGNVANIAINSNGYLAVALTGTIYKTFIQTFDNKGTELFSTCLRTTYTEDIDISPDNKYLAIAEINYSGILIQSNIKIISIDKAKNDEKDAIRYSHLCEEGDLLINIKYQSKDELICVFDNHIESIKNESINVVSKFNTDEILFADLNNKIIEITKEKSNVYLEIINSSNQNKKKYEINEPKEICVSDNVVAINLGSEILFYNNSGWLIKRYYAKQEINKIVLCDNLAGVVYNDKIELVSL